MASKKVNFASLLEQIHAGATAAPVVTDQEQYIQITDDRQFELPEGFNHVIAYEGDVNSQIITFDCPRIHEGHDLYACSHKKLRWVNATSGNEGSSNLTTIENTDDRMLLKWEVPADAFTKSGIISLSITIFDLIDKKLAFSWNTASFSQLTVGDTLTSVSYNVDYTEEAVTKKHYVPSPDEVLLVNIENRNIVAPSGYNYTICNYGDINITTLYFQIKRYFKGFDMLNSGIYIKWNVGGMFGQTDSQPNRKLYVVDLENRDEEGMVNIVWEIPPSITKNELKYSGPISIQMQIYSEDGKVWNSNPFTKLVIGNNNFSGTATDLPDFPEDQKENGQYIIQGNETNIQNEFLPVAGIVTLRSFTPNRNISLRKNEIAVEYDLNGEYVGIRLGTQELGQSASSAPYIAYSNAKIARIMGGTSDMEENNG